MSVLDESFWELSREASIAWLSEAFWLKSVSESFISVPSDAFELKSVYDAFICVPPGASWEKLLKGEFISVLLVAKLVFVLKMLPELPRPSLCPIPTSSMLLLAYWSKPFETRVWDPVSNCEGSSCGGEP